MSLSASSESLVNTTVGGNQQSPQIAKLADGGFVVVWQDDSGTGADSSGYAVRAQRYDASGAKVGPEWLVNGNVAGDQYEPKVIGLESGGFVIVWTDNTGDASGAGVRARIYDSGGTPVGAEFLVNTDMNDQQWQPVPEALPGGGFVVTWAHRSGDASLYAVKGQIFDSSGAKVGAEFLVNTTEFLYQDNGKVTALPGGGFVVVWNDFSHSGGDSSGYSVKGQIFDAAGNKLGGEFLVNSDTAFDQGVGNRSVSALGSGGFVVAWASNDPAADGSGYAVKAQIFDASGTRIGGEFLVNTNAAGDQFEPVTLALPGGGFLIAWTDSTGDDSGQAVKGRIFDASGAPAGDEFLLNGITAGDQVAPMIAAHGSGFAAVWADNSHLNGDSSGYGVALRLFSLANVINGTEEDDLLFGTPDDDVINGLGGNDQIVGLQGNDLLNGDDGDDVMSGNSGNDTLHGGDGNDNLNGNPGDDAVYGGDGEDLVVGGPGNDSLYGGAGHDFLRGDPPDGLSPGDDYIDGGPGFDRVTYYNINNGVTVSLLLQGAPQNTGQGMDTLLDVEAVSGSVFSDVLIGDDNDNWLYFGAAGLDGVTITSDTISGNGGDDLIVVGTGDHDVDGGSGVDTLGFNWNTNEVAGGVTVSLALQGAAQATGQGSMTLDRFENLSGSVFDDVLTGDGGNNLLAGSAGADILYGGAGNDVLLGDGAVNMSPSNAGPVTVFEALDFAGVDFYDAAGNIVYVFNGQDLYDVGGHALARADLVDEDGTPYSRFTLGAVTYDFYHGDLTRSDGLAGSDILFGGDGDDTLIGGAGNDTLIGGAGTDSLDGGPGLDTVSYWDASGPVDLDLGAGLADEYAADGITYLTTDTLSGIEYAIGSAFDDALVGSSGDNYLDGAGGNDLVVGGAGNDQVNGGDGDDLLRGDGFNNYTGPSGNDLLYGGAGDDIMWTSDGVDFYDGGDGFDRVSFFSFAATQGAIASLITQTIQNDGFGNAETMVSIEALGAGTAYADHLTGDDNANLLLGDLGDTLIGNGGDDSFQLSGAPALTDGGSGIDTILRFVGDIFGSIRPDSNGDGLAELVFATNGVHVDLGLGMIVDDGFGNSGTLVSIENVGGSDLDDILAGDGNGNVLQGLGGDDRLDGRGGDDRLEGGGGNDALDGGKGNDILTGGGGDDVLTGGQGEDRFVFGTGSGHDRITDFAKKDVIAFTSGPQDFAELTFTAVGKDTLISWGTGDTILVEGMKPKQLSAADFSFESFAAMASFPASDGGWAHSAMEDAAAHVIRIV